MSIIPVSNFFRILFFSVLLLMFTSTTWAAEDCVTSGIAIPDNNAAGVVRTIFVGETFDKIIKDLNVRLDISHPKRGDLDISLKHIPSGTTVKLIERPNSGAGDCAENGYDHTFLDDESTDGSIQSAANCTPALDKVSYVPAQPLSAFDGLDVNGNWEFLIKDLAAGMSGTFHEACLLWNPTELSVETFSSAKPVAGSNEFTITHRIKNNGPYKAYNVVYSIQATLVSMGLAYVSTEVSQGSYGLNGLPTIAAIVANLGHLEVGKSADIDVTYMSYGALPFPLIETLVLYPDTPESLPSELHTYPLFYDASMHPAEVSGAVVKVADSSNDGGAGTFDDACQPLTNAAEVNGNIALVNARSPFGANPFETPPDPFAAPCGFVDQVNNAVAAGAKAVILSSSFSDLFIAGPIPATPGQPVPVVTVSKTDYDLLMGATNPSVTLKLGFPRVWNSLTPIVGDFTSFLYEPVALLNRYDNPDLYLSYFAHDKDEDSVADVLERCNEDPGKTLPGQCGCGVVDSDPDGDGTASCLDSCPNDPDKLSAGICGCGLSDKDSDGDSSVDCNDGCPSDPAKTSGGVCGCGVADSDSNADSIIDCTINASFKGMLAEAKNLLAALTPKKKKTKALRAQLKALKDQLFDVAGANVNLFSVLSGGDITKLSKKVKRGIQKSLRAKENKKLKKAVKKATKSIDSLDAVLA